MLGRRGFIGGVAALVGVLLGRRSAATDVLCDKPGPEVRDIPVAEFYTATCTACGHRWPLRPHPPASFAGKDLGFRFCGTGSDGDRYVFSLCPNCGKDWIGDLGFSGAISRGPECLQASQHYEWDDDDE